MAQPEESEPNLSENESAEEQNTDVEIVNDSNNESLVFGSPSTVVENESNIGEGEAEELEEDVENEGVNVDGSIASSIQVASTASSVELEDEYDDDLVIELGDEVVIDSKQHARTIGTVYYRDFDIIRVKPYGSTNTVIDFELVQDDDGEDFKESEGVTFSAIKQKRTQFAFVEQQDFRVNHTIHTYSADGTFHESYVITDVNEKADTMIIQSDSGDSIPIECRYKGIPRDAGFAVIFVTGYKEKEKVEEESVEESAEALAEEIDEDLEDPSEESNEVEFIGFVDIIESDVYTEAQAYEQYIPDNLQKIDAFNNFIEGLDPAVQKDPKAIRMIRILVETLYRLKQETVAYGRDGSIQGPKPASASSLMDLIRQVPIPLGRPVLDMIKKEYYVANDEDRPEEDDHVSFLHFDQELIQMKQNSDQLASALMVGSKKGSVVEMWNQMQSFFTKYGSPWISTEKQEPIWGAQVDSDVFRYEAPSLEEPSLPGYLPSHNEKIMPIFDVVPFGMERALSTTYRKGKDYKKQVLLSEDDASLRSYLLFPISTANELGSTRSRSLAVDSGRSQLPPQTMKMILEKTGEPTEVGESDKLLLLKEGTLSNIPFADYIEGISPIHALGLGDTFDTLEQYGMESLELNEPLARVLETKIKLYQSHLISLLNAQRSKIVEQAPAPQPNPFLEDPEFLKDIIAEPLLQNDLEEYERINISLAQSDIGKVSALMKRHPEYFQIAAGGNPTLMIKAQAQAYQLDYHKRLTINKILKLNEANSGERAKKNNCSHVSNLVSIRKLRDDNERFQQLTSFFTIYQGTRIDNWIDCNQCQSHLLCMHERLQIQAFLHPNEKSTIEKEILLNFSGGQFQGKYICRNCGQPIRDLDFDNNIEFDDNGKPKSGRAVLVDEDAILEDEIDAMLLNVPIEPSPVNEMKLTEGEQTACYYILYELAAILGVSFEKPEYVVMIDRIMMWISKFPDRAKYNKMREANEKMLEFDIIYSRLLISAAASFLLIQLQVKIPSVAARFPIMGCASPGFGGFPLDVDETHQQGIKYIACAVASIQKKTAPWNQTRFDKLKEEKRQATVVQYMMGVLKDVQDHDLIQVQLTRKRKYTISYPSDVIPPTFLPEQIVITPEDAAKDVITPEVVQMMGNKGEMALVKLWIRQSHLLARANAILSRGSPLVETTCCIAKIETPGEFWKRAESDIPIGVRKLIPNQQGNFLLTEFIPREVGGTVARPNPDEYYRLFLKYCYEGPRVGHPHEPGLTNICPWCKFEFPAHISVMDTKEGEAALITQQVNTGEDAFTVLLDTIHIVNEVPLIVMEERTSLLEVMKELATIAHPPIGGWDALMTETIERIGRLTPQSTKREMIEAIGPLSSIGQKIEQSVKQTLQKSLSLSVLDTIADLSWNDFFKVIQTYFIVPFQRVVSQYKPTALFIPHELASELSKVHVEEALLPILNKELKFVKDYESKIMNVQSNYARARLSDYIQRMSDVLAFKNKLRPSVGANGEKALEYKYIQQILLYGPLAILMDKTIQPAGMVAMGPITAATNPSFDFLKLIIISSLDKFSSERLSYNEEELRNLIAVRNAKERSYILSKFDKLSDEERTVELIKKNLKMGDWAAGSKIYAYDAGHWEMERQQRIDAGMMDFSGQPDGSPNLEGRKVDSIGLFDMNDAEMGDDGYEVGEVDDDGDS
jgi:hypothetical protein